MAAITTKKVSRKFSKFLIKEKTINQLNAAFERFLKDYEHRADTNYIGKKQKLNVKFEKKRETVGYRDVVRDSLKVQRNDFSIHELFDKKKQSTWTNRWEGTNL